MEVDGTWCQQREVEADASLLGAPNLAKQLNGSAQPHGVPRPPAGRSAKLWPQYCNSLAASYLVRLIEYGTLVLAESSQVKSRQLHTWCLIHSWISQPESYGSGGENLRTRNFQLAIPSAHCNSTKGRHPLRYFILPTGVQQLRVQLL